MAPYSSMPKRWSMRPVRTKSPLMMAVTPVWTSITFGLDRAHASMFFISASASVARALSLVIQNRTVA